MIGTFGWLLLLFCFHGKEERSSSPFSSSCQGNVNSFRQQKMTELWSYLCHQCQHLGKHFLSFFGITEHQAELIKWKNKFEKHMQEKDLDRKLIDILSRDESEEEHVLKDMEATIKVLSSEDKGLILKKQLLKNKIKTIRGIVLKPTEQIPAVPLPQCHSVLLQNDHDQNSMTYDLAACEKWTDERHGVSNRTTNQDWLETKEKVGILENSNNCAGERDAENQMMLPKKEDKNQICAENVSPMAAEDVSYCNEEENITFRKGSSTEPKIKEIKKRKSGSFLKYVSPEIRRKMSVTEYMGSESDFSTTLTDEEIANARHTSDYISEGKDPFSSSNSSPVTAPADKLPVCSSVMKESENQGSRQSRFRLAIIPAKFKRKFLPRRRDRKHMDSGSAICEVNSGSASYFQVQSARKFSDAVFLKRIKKSSSFATYGMNSCKDLQTEASDIEIGSKMDRSTWKWQMQSSDRHIPLGKTAYDPDWNHHLRTTFNPMVEVSDFHTITRQHGDAVKSQPDQPALKNDQVSQPASCLNREEAQISKSRDGSQKCIRPRFSMRERNSSIQHVAAYIDTNKNMSKTPCVDKLTDTRQSLMKIKWKSMSTPNLCYGRQKEKEYRCLSQDDLPTSSQWDLKVKKRRLQDVKDFEETPLLLWGEAAYKHYKLLATMEAKRKIETIKKIKAEIVNKYYWKQEMLDNIVRAARAYYSNPTGKNRDQWKKLKKEILQSSDNSITDFRHKLATLPDYPAFFTYFVMLAQIVTLAVICIYGKLAPLGILSQKELRKEMQTFLGAEMFHRWIPPNPWIGPSPKAFLEMGATFAPCLRRDRHVLELSEINKYKKLDDTNFGCCQMPGPINAAGTTMKEECELWTNGAGRWGPPLCTNRLPGKNSIAQVIRPCCVDHQGTCKMTSYEHCDFIGGTFHITKEHCVEVNCIEGVCTIGNSFVVESDPEKPWLPAKDTVWQWWRLLISLLYTFGILHCLTLLTIQWLLMRPLETSAGWLRIMLTYIFCGVAGQIVASIAQPYVPHVGSTSGVAGMIGEAALELGQAWHLLKKPQNELIKLASFLLILLLMGLLPYVSFLATITGFVCGAVCALIFMPYITFDRWAKGQRVVLVITGLLLLAVIYISILFAFIQLQPRPCLPCRLLECVSLTENMCDEWDLFG